MERYFFCFQVIAESFIGIVKNHTYKKTSYYPKTNITSATSFFATIRRKTWLSRSIVNKQIKSTKTKYFFDLWN